MDKLSIVLTILMVVFNFNTFADENECREVKLGSIGKKYWNDSLDNGFRGELLQTLDKEDDIWENLLPEIEYEFTDNFKVKSKLTREIKDNLPLPDHFKITKKDLFTWLVKDKLQVELSANAGVGIFSAGGNVGVNLTHASHMYPGKRMSTCEVYSKLIDKDDPIAEGFIEEACEHRNRNNFANYYDNIINFFSKMVGKVAHPFTDSEKSKEIFRDPLSPLKLHTRLGIPLDYEVFFENNQEVGVGDIIEHTTFFGLTPLAVNFGLFEFLGPGFSRYYRFFRNISFKKEYKNKVIIEIQDIVFSGNSTDIFQIRPKFFGLFKVNFGKWYKNDFNKQSMTQHFEVDLNQDSGLKFFKKILRNSYNMQVNVDDDSVIIDHTRYGDAVVAKPPLYQKGKGDDYNFVLKFPGIFKYNKRTYNQIKNVTFKGREYSIGEKLLTRNIKNKLGLNLGVFEISKKDKDFTCAIKFTSDLQAVADKDKSSTNIECNYKNKYGKTEDIKKLAEYIDIVSLGKMAKNDREKFKNLKHPKPGNLNMYTNLSFSHTTIQRILKVNEDQIYAEISKLFFGDDALNIFAKKYHHLWNDLRPKTARDSAISRHRLNSQRMTSCSEFLYRTGLTPYHDHRYENFYGLVGNGKGLEGVKTNRCWNFYHTARKIAAKIMVFQESFKDTNRLNRLIDLFYNVHETAFAQAVLARLVGGTEKGSVHFAYIVASPYLKQMIAHSNGNPYDIGDPGLRRDLSEQINAQFYPRINDVEVRYNTCEKNVLYAYLKLNYKLADRGEIFGSFDFRKHKTATSDIPLEKFVIPFDEMVAFPKERDFVARLKLDTELDINKSYSLYFKLTNEPGFRLSREVPIFLKRVNGFIELPFGFNKDKDKRSDRFESSL